MDGQGHGFPHPVLPNPALPWPSPLYTHPIQQYVRRCSTPHSVPPTPFHPMQDTPHKPTFPHLGASFHPILPLSDFIPPHLTQHRPFQPHHLSSSLRASNLIHLNPSYLTPSAKYNALASSVFQPPPFPVALHVL